jgi:hypothetical protein
VVNFCRHFVFTSAVSRGNAVALSELGQAHFTIDKGSLGP